VSHPTRGDAPLTSLAGLDGARIEGGCDYCDAYQTVAPAVAGVWTLAVHHDDWCPWLRQREWARS
jgi:hypothetical protein